MAHAVDCSGAQAPAFVPTFKFVFRNDIRRWTPDAPLSFDSIFEKLLQLYLFPADARVQLKFVDPDGDQITLGNNQDLAELLLLRIPVTKIFVFLASPDGPEHGGTARASKQAKNATSDSETEDGLWTPERLDKYLARLTKLLTIPDEEGPVSFRLAKMLSRGSVKTDQAGEQRIIHCIQQIADSNPAAKIALRRVANGPPGKWQHREAPAAAQGLALKALEALGVETSADEGEGSDGGKWGEARLDKYLAKLTQHLANLSRDDSSVVELVRLLTKGGKNTDGTGQDRIVGHLRLALESGKDLLREVLSALAYEPSKLGLARPHIPGRALAMRAIGGDVSSLPVPPRTHGPRCHGNKWGAHNGKGHRGRGRNGCGGGHGCGRGGGAWARNKQDKPHARLLCDVTVPDETRVAPGQRFTKVWRVANSGELPWDPKTKGLVLLHVDGHPIGSATSTPQCVATGPPPPGGTTDLSVEMTAPMVPGRYEGFFRLAILPEDPSTEAPVRFGQRVWARIVVEDPKAGVYPVIEGMAGLKVLPDPNAPAPGQA